MSKFMSYNQDLNKYDQRDLNPNHTCDDKYPNHHVINDLYF